MIKIRKFEERTIHLYQENRIWGHLHPCIGQEAVATGSCLTLNKEDYILSTHRGHGHCIAKGGNIKRMMSELLGKETGSCRGRGGSMHITDTESGILG
ncbi:pyruvate dehydrogenase (acetyl-transferring) E1 component subunit alpha, partial [bacterium]|nr:pyruvate dehydrogenase (acetyl-transferring) E1 component subunit alpha [bacterium]